MIDVRDVLGIVKDLYDEASWAEQRAHQEYDDAVEKGYKDGSDDYFFGMFTAYADCRDRAHKAYLILKSGFPNLGEETMTRYYSTQRPVEPGSYPKPKDNEVLNIVNFDQRQEVRRIGRSAWGYIDYDHELTEDEARNYELVKDVM